MVARPWSNPSIPEGRTCQSTVAPRATTRLWSVGPHPLKTLTPLTSGPHPLLFSPPSLSHPRARSGTHHPGVRPYRCASPSSSSSLSLSLANQSPPPSFPPPPEPPESDAAPPRHPVPPALFLTSPPQEIVNLLGKQASTRVVRAVPCDRSPCGVATRIWCLSLMLR